MNNHLQPHELRIGNWVNLFGERYDKVRCADFNMLHTELFSSVDYKHVFGIPITKEWLERLGFYDDTYANFHLDLCSNNFMLSVHFSDYECKELVSVELNEVEIPMLYIHQLQNLYQALTQNELKIKE